MIRLTHILFIIIFSTEKSYEDFANFSRYN